MFKTAKNGCKTWVLNGFLFTYFAQGFGKKLKLVQNPWKTGWFLHTKRTWLSPTNTLNSTTGLGMIYTHLHKLNNKNNN